MHESNLHAPPALYLAAIGDVFAGNFLGEDLARVGNHLFRWLHISGTSDSWYGIILNALAFVGAVAALTVPRLSTPTVRLLAATAVANHCVLFFWEPNRRYAMIAWTLSYLVTVAVVHRWWLRRRRYPAGATDDYADTKAEA
ncbi:MAG: hypothetical protein GY791_14130 [Alphaproteobacteria bacterium]|nr:hypothetical protein [Alphaproteobacteria bacterium]